MPPPPSSDPHQTTSLPVTQPSPPTDTSSTIPNVDDDISSRATSLGLGMNSTGPTTTQTTQNQTGPALLLINPEIIQPTPNLSNPIPANPNPHTLPSPPQTLF